jgi:tetratricopeptide (TPR) repeat protein
MDHFDQFPKRDDNRGIEERAVAAFNALLATSEAFDLQASDRRDYGTDCQIEAVSSEAASNARVHVQIKGTRRELNSDGSVSVQVARTNLNYLLVQPHSIYVCHHEPSRSLRVRTAESVLRQYEHSGRGWTEQESLTIKFGTELTAEWLDEYSALVRSSAIASRRRRSDQIGTSASLVPALLRRRAPDIHVPADREAAAELLQHLYAEGADDAISAAFDQFAAVLGRGSDAMGPAYMAEINFGMDGKEIDRDRVEAAIKHFRNKLRHRRFQPASLNYTIGNAYSALDRDVEARVAYETALSDPKIARMADLAAQIEKNLGTSVERLGDEVLAASHYHRALELDPSLPEAHYALGQYHIRHGRYQEALDHFDQVVFEKRHPNAMTGAAGWRMNALFNLGEGRAAFREITSMLGRAEHEIWIWPWCARLVALFGRTTADNARQALAFWRRYVARHPDHPRARSELLMATFYLRGQGVDIGRTYRDFRVEFDEHIVKADVSDAALPWDRLGHWAQEEEDWDEAERCYRRAYDLDGGEYGYCLGTALLFLGRYEECLPLLLDQAERIQPDALSWVQVANAYLHLDRTDDAVAAFRKATEIDPADGTAFFELAGALWNKGERDEAVNIWWEALGSFPEHELRDQALECVAIHLASGVLAEEGPADPTEVRS